MPSPSLFLGSCTTLVFVLNLFSASVNAATGQGYVYSLKKEYSNASFFDEWDFYNELDPTKGFVNYVDRQTARQAGLIQSNDGADAIMAVDSTNTYDADTPYQSVDGYGRPSVRIMTQQSFYHGLFVADIKHMPFGCGTWPAFWTLGADNNWPNSGEIDIIEGVNNEQNNVASMHTGGQCKIAGDSRTMTGILQGTDCFYDVTTGQGAVGCGVLDTDTKSYGKGFNDAGGAVFAMEWTSNAIKMWSFPRQQVPPDLVYGAAPNPSRWGLPAQIFTGPDCVIDNVIKPQKLIFNTDFCGDFGDAVWSSEGCAASTGYNSCAAYVGSNPAAFADAYWQISSLKYYAQVSGLTTISTASSTQSSSYTTLSTETLTTTTSSVDRTSLASASTPGQPANSFTTITIRISTSPTLISPTLISTSTQTETATPSSRSSTSLIPTIVSGPSSATSSPALSSTSLILISPIVAFVQPTTVTSNTISPITISSSQYVWSNWAEANEMTSGKPQGSFFRPPMGSGIPITAGWDAPRPGPESEFWSPITLNKLSHSTATDTWVEWPDKVITITKTWIEPCKTGYTTKTTIVVTKHCGCTDIPVPTIPMRVITTTCPKEWGFKTPLVVTIPDTAVATQPAWPVKPTGKADAAETWVAEAKSTAREPNTWVSWDSDHKAPADHTGPRKFLTSNSDSSINSLKSPAAAATETSIWASWSSDSDSDSDSDSGSNNNNRVNKNHNNNNDNNDAPPPHPTTYATTWSTLALPPQPSTQTQTQTQNPTPPAPAASTSPSHLWANYYGTEVATGHVAKYTGAATKVSITTAVLGAVVMIAAFVV